ncbi:MAG: phosphoethanolamine transferase [Sneathiella sp.]|nr:phosphoethanolamine transferase [Sneathiella sp.]
MIKYTKIEGTEVGELSRKINLAMLPLALFVLSMSLNMDKIFNEPLSGAVHVLFQGVLFYGVFALIHTKMFLRFVFASILVVEAFTQIAYGASLSVGLVMSVLNTNSGEFLSFMRFNIVEILLFLFLLFSCTYFPTAQNSRANMGLAIIGGAYVVLPTLASAQTLWKAPRFQSRLETAAKGNASELLVGASYFLGDMRDRFPPLKSMKGVVDTARFLFLSDATLTRRKKTSSSWSEVTVDKDSPELLIIGIGESLRAKNLSLYGYGRETTPNLSKLANNLSVFSSAYSAGPNTWTSVPASLTKHSTGFDLSKSIINLAKEAGYESYWFSNHAKYSEWDISVSAIAGQADFTYFASNQNAGVKYDAVLLEQLSTILESEKSDKKRLIILHFYGSHMHFEDRYPKKFAQFVGKNSLLNQYDNSILYTDFVQSEVIEIVRKHGGEYIFFADHGLGKPGGRLSLKHDGRKRPDIDSLNVPFFTFGKRTLSLEKDDPVSLLYFECIFSEWSGISAKELEEDKYCQDKLKSGKIQFINNSLELVEVGAD